MAAVSACADSFSRDDLANHERGFRFEWKAGHESDEVRYLAATGDDAADGKTPATAWRTVGKLNADLPAGGTARLRCGDTFYGTVRVSAGRDATHPTVLTSWGEGTKPTISCTKNLKHDPSVWEDLTHGFWRVDLRNPTNFTGLVTDDCNPGFLLVDGEVRAWKRYCHSDLVSPWDFCGEDGWLYVHAPENPARLARDIRVALNVCGLWFSSYMIVSNIAVRATGAHAMHGGWGCDLRHVRIADCEFENVGGSELESYAKTAKFRIRYGNGIELGGDAEDVLVERCSFRGVYDVAFTMQGFPKKGWQDVHVRDCMMTDCTQAFEIWCKNAPKGVGFDRCSFTDNHTLRVGGGWGEMVRPHRVCATPLLVYSLQTDTVDIDVSGNVFADAPHGVLYVNGYGVTPDVLPPGYRMSGNVVVTKEDK